MSVDWGTLRRIEPVSRQFGFDRGTPVDRYYIERFLQVNSDCISGRVLEIGDNTYTRRFGGERVRRSDVFHVHARNPQATIIGDLATADTIPSDIFDCTIVTQTLQLILNPLAALRTLHRILRPGGVLLATVPALTPVSHESDEWSQMWYWSFTAASIRRLMEAAFGPGSTRIKAHGNVFAGVCMLQGVAVEDITPAELDRPDPDYTIVLTIRAAKQSV